jgi:UDP-glucose 4-epimerase
LSKGGKTDVINLGTGVGYSVKEIIDVSEEITGKKINTEITERREGDPAILVADNKKAKEILGWEPKYNLKDIISSAYNWHKSPRF